MHAFTGEWKEDQQHGHGVFIDDDGNFYDGEWRADLKHGHGTYHFANGDEALSGLWCDNEFVEED